MHPDILKFNERQQASHQAVCDLLAQVIDKYLLGSESKIWHGHPVWFLDVIGKKFKDASIFFNDVSEVNKTEPRRWLKKAQMIQWGYKNLVRRGCLERIEAGQP